MEGEANDVMYIDGKCGKCGSMNVSFNYFDADERNKGFQEFTCRACGAITYQTFVYTITGQEVTTTEEKERRDE